MAKPGAKVAYTPPSAKVVLRGRTVVLRPYEERDVDELFAAAVESVAHINPWLPWCHGSYARPDAESWVDFAAAAWVRGDEFNFVIADAATDRLVGGCGLNGIDKVNLRANLGYWVRASALRRGIAVEATQLLARFGLTTLGLNRVEIIAALANAASQKVALRAGAVREGTARAALRLHERAHDAAVFSLVRTDATAVDAQPEAGDQ